MIEPVPQEWLEKDRKAKQGQVIARRLSEVAPEPVEWLWDQRIVANKLNIVHGDPGAGKTWLVLDILAQVTTGRPFCDGAPCMSAEVAFATDEDGLADTIRGYGPGGRGAVRPRR